MHIAHSLMLIIRHFLDVSDFNNISFKVFLMSRSAIFNIFFINI